MDEDFTELWDHSGNASICEPGGGRAMKPRRTLDPETVEVMGVFLRTKRAELAEAIRHLADHRAADALGASGPEPCRPRTFLEDIQAALAHRQTRKLAEIEAALARLGRGEYGLCGDCDGPIGLPRLRMLPFAARCGRCQSHADLRVHRATRAVVAQIGAGRPVARAQRA
jgi:RNA polymerase-binding transcription factor DksA